MNARAHPAEDELLAWWLGDAGDAAAEAAIDEHLLACDACGARVDEFAAFGEGVRALFDSGRLRGFVGAGFVERLRASGRRVREYRVPCGGSVACSVAPDDDFVVSRLELPPGHGARRIDALLVSTLAEGEERVADVPFDPDTGELWSMPRLAPLRAAPAHRSQVTLLAVDEDGERVLGRYAFEHRPWPG